MVATISLPGCTKEVPVAFDSSKLNLLRNPSKAFVCKELRARKVAALLTGQAQKKEAAARRKHGLKFCEFHCRCSAKTTPLGEKKVENSTLLVY